MKRILMPASLLAGFGLAGFGGSALVQESDTTSSFGRQSGANLDEDSDG